MAIADPTRRFDGFNNLSGGMDSGRTPEALAEDNAALGVNVTMRTGWPETRPSFAKRSPVDKVVDPDALAADPLAAWTAFSAGFFQGAASYYNPATGAQALIAVSSGRIFEIETPGFAIREITPASGGNDTSAKCFFCQAESYLVIQNGEDRPLIYDGAMLRRTVTDGDEVPVGTIMAYGQGRLVVADPARREIIVGDLVHGGSLSQVEIDRSDKIILSSTPVRSRPPIEFTMSKITTKTAHGFANGDTVTIKTHYSSEVAINATWLVRDVTEKTFVVPFAATLSGSGGTVERFNDGKEADLLRFTETSYLNEKGVFRLPASMGRITAMVFFPVQDTSTGQGELLVLGEHGAASFALSAPREQWLDLAIQKVALVQVGATSPTALVTINSDVFFRSNDGLRSYRNAAIEFSNAFGQTPLSTELDRVLRYDSAPLLPEVSAGALNDRLLFTASPVQLPLTDGDPFAPVPTVFRALAVLDFHSAGRLSRKGSPSYDGIWTGLDILQLVSARFAGQERAFLFTFTPERTTELWEITRDVSSGTDYADEPTKIAFLGDGGMDNDAARAVAAMVKRFGATDVVLAGDLNYPDGAAADFDAKMGQHWRPFMFPFHGDWPLKAGEASAKSNRCWPCPGNHEWVATDTLVAYQSYTNAPGADSYYTKVLGDLQIFVLSSDPHESAHGGLGVDGDQYAWFIAALAASTARFKGVIFHHPPYTSGSSYGNNTAMQAWNLESLGVHFVVCGHDHGYERIDKSGVPFFVVGTGGAALHGTDGVLETGSQVRLLKHGALILEMTEDALTFKFRDTGGKVLDTYAVTTPDAEAHVPRIVRRERRIMCAVEAKALSFQAPYSLKKLVRGDLWLANLMGETAFRVFWRPDVHPYWFFWGSFEKDVEGNAGDPPGVPPIALHPAMAPQVMLPTPPKIDDVNVRNRPANLGYTFQLRIEWDGRAQVQKCVLHAVDILEGAQAHPPGESVLQTVPAQGAAVPAPAQTNLLAHTAR